MVINDTVTLYPIPGTNGDGWTDQPPVVAAEPVSEPGYRGTRSLESRLALAVNEAHYYLCCVKEGIAERSPGWSIRLRDRLGAILEEAERAGLLEGAALSACEGGDLISRGTGGSDGTHEPGASTDTG